MGILSRLKILEKDMYTRKIEEKLKEYTEKYEIEFWIRCGSFDEWGLYTIGRDRVAFLSCGNSLEKVYDGLVECEDEIKVYLYDKIKAENELLKARIKDEEVER